MTEKTDDKPKKIGLMFGSFNPPHQGHIDSCQKAKDSQGLSEVWMMPVPVSALKRNSFQASFEEKLEMCRLATRDVSDWLKITDNCRDFKCGTIGQVQSIKRLLQNVSKERNDAEFSIVCGDDFKEKYERVCQFFASISMVAGVVNDTVPMKPDVVRRLLDRVERVGQVLRAHPVVSVERAKVYSPTEVDAQKKGLSSTLIRAALAEPVDHVDGLPDAVLSYIRQKGLYVPQP